MSRPQAKSQPERTLNAQRRGRVIRLATLERMCAALSFGAVGVAVRAAPVAVSVQTADGLTREGRILTFSFGEGAMLEVAPNETVHIPATDVVRIRAGEPRTPADPRAIALRLPGGDRIVGHIAEGDADHLSLVHGDLGRVRLPLSAVLEVRTPQAEEPIHQAAVQWFDPSALGRDRDAVLLRNGDVIEGFVDRIGADGIALELEEGEVTLRFDAVLLLRLSNRNRIELPPAYAHLVLSGGDRLTATKMTWEQDRVTAVLPYGATVSFEARRLASLEFVGGRWEWLDDHRPISFEHTPMLALDWPVAFGRNVRGGLLRVGGTTFERGIGVHSRCRLTYNLRGEYREFVTSFGIDDDSGPFADVSVHVLIDGRHRFEQSAVRRGALHGPVRINVTGANSLELLVDFGAHGDVQDRFNWIESALVR